MTDELTDKEEWKRGSDLLEEGMGAIYNDVGIHSSDETLRHYVVKAVLAKCLHDAGRSWGCEVELGGGRGVVDIIDLGPADGRAIVYEVESTVTPQRKQAKVDQYVGGLVRDVIVIPAEECPADWRAIPEWLQGYVLGIEL